MNNILEQRLQQFAEDWKVMDLLPQKYLTDKLAYEYMRKIAREKDLNKWAEYYENCKVILK